MVGDAFDLWEREAECALLDAAIKDAVQGRGRLVLVEGPGGIGKSRLLAEARHQAGEAGAQVASARGTELERDFAFGMVRQLFESLLLRADTTTRETLWTGPAAQARAVFEDVGGDAHDVPGDFAVLHGLFWLTANACQKQPLVLVVDDLHWCDVPSLRFLAYLMPRLDGLQVLIIAALRTGARPADDRLLAPLLADSNVLVLRPGLLNESSTAQLLGQALPAPVDPTFAGACHAASGGNPLLLFELTRTLAAERITPSAENAGKVADLGASAVSRLVRARLTHLPLETQALVQTVAILGDRVALSIAAAVTGQSMASTNDHAATLERLDILRTDGSTVSFVHPLVRTAVYATVGPAKRAAAHSEAARLLAKVGASPEQIAAQLLHAPPARDAEAVVFLQQAAEQAVRRGSPQAAFIYLERALQEPPATAEETAALLGQAGAVAQLVDWRKARNYLSQALQIASEPTARAGIVEPLARALFMLGQNHEAVPLYEQAIAALHSEEHFLDLRQQLQAGLINVTVANAQLHGKADSLVSRLRAIPTSPGVGGRCLDAILGWHTAIAAVDRDEAVRLTRRALAGGVLVDQASDTEVLADAEWVLIAADLEEVFSVFETALAGAYRRGTTTAIAVAACLRSLAWYRCGQLTEAEADATQAREICATANLDVAYPLVASFLADTLLDRGHLDQAAEVLDWADHAELPATAAQWYWAQASKGRLLLKQGKTQQGLELLTECGQRYAAHGWYNPAFLSWRPDAVLALHLLGQDSEARVLAREDLHFAREWGAPWALGRALRATGMVTAGEEGLALLEEAVRVLEPSWARLEHAAALADLGATLRRANQREKARTPLRQALDLATRCGAAPLADQARSELAVAGGRPRRLTLMGPDALTPSERRIAELAASGGLTNRQIAQQLYVTPKTVEVHLSAVYRKLSITSRLQLGSALSALAAPSADRRTS
jgi:DNA-binding CsgD family transcriptional regulator